MSHTKSGKKNTNVKTVLGRMQHLYTNKILVIKKVIFILVNDN